MTDTPQDRWKARNMKRLSLWLPKALAEEFDQVIKDRGDTKAGVIRQAIEDYIEEDK